MRIAQVTMAAAAALFTGQAVWSQEAVASPPSGWFPFTMNPAAPATDSPADVSFMNGGPAERRISVRGGQFVDDRGERVRFLGTNVTFSGAFPEKEAAPAVAARLAQLGFNVVRFHHMDARDIWLPGQAGLDSAKLDRLDWFLFQLKQHGVYANINLHVSRTYPGLGAQAEARAFRYGKTLDMYHEPFIRLQEQYARDLLDRVNPYTGLKLSADPAVAFVELNNENTLLAFTPAILDSLTTPELRESLRGVWGAWLARHYDSVPQVVVAWNQGAHPLGDEMLRNPHFGGTLEDWTLEGKAPGVCDLTRSEADGGALQVRIEAQGKTSWAYQVHQFDVTLQEGETYTIRFRGRSEPPRQVSVGLRFAEPPWTVLSGNHSVALTPDWREHVIVCRVQGLKAGLRQRLSFNLGDQPGQVWLADASLRSGRELLQADAVQSVAGMPLPGNTASERCWADFRRCLIETEQAYVSRLKKLLQGELGVRALVVDSQASYGGYWGLWREASLGDYVDMHSYWQHPHFPGKPWDPNNWTIGNTSMVADANGGTLPKLAMYRQVGMPFSVSEYNHPAPNEHAAELFPLITSFGAFQDWDAIYQFAYCNTVDGYGPGKIGSYFELCHHPAQLVFAPLCALLFRQGLVAPAEQALTATIPMAALSAGLDAGFAGPDTLLDRARLPAWAALGRRLSVRVDAAGKGLEPLLPSLGEPPPEGRLLQSAQIDWVTGEAPLFTVVAPAARVAVGRLGGADTVLGDTTLRVNLPAGQWACAVLVSADGKPVSASARLLLAIVTRAENTGTKWDDARRSIGRNWGKEPVLVQAVPFVLDGPGTPPRVTALGTSGERAQAQEVATVAEGWRLTVPGTTQAPWYALERP